VADEIGEVGGELRLIKKVLPGLVWKSIHHEGHEEHEGKKI
jgi:hypothetical protein